MAVVVGDGFRFQRAAVCVVSHPIVVLVEAKEPINPLIHAIHSSPRTAIDISSDIVCPPDGINVVAMIAKRGSFAIIDTGLGSLRETTDRNCDQDNGGDQCQSRLSR